MSVFLAWMPDEDAQRDIASVRDAAMAALGPDASRHRWRRPDHWHITLRYLGDTIDAALQARIATGIDAVARAAAPHDVAADRLDAWPRANVLVLRTTLPPALADLIGRIEAAVRGRGFRADPKAKHPHVTLAYLDPRAWPVAGTLPPLPPGRSFAVDRIRLLRSTGTGRYQTLHEWPLTGDGRSAQANLF